MDLGEDKGKKIFCKRVWNDNKRLRLFFYLKSTYCSLFLWHISPFVKEKGICV